MATAQPGQPVRTVTNLTPPVSETQALAANGYANGKTLQQQKRDRIVARGGNLDRHTDSGALYANDYQFAYAPVNTVAPVLSGTASVGQTLSVTTGTWTGTPTPTYTYVWKADTTVISGATASTYVLTSGETGKTITVVVTATNEQAAVNATSNALGPVA